MKYSEIPALHLLQRMSSHGIHASQGKHVLSWLIKATLLEPFRLVELGLYNRKIKAHQIQQDPIFILGYYRSGTTYLQRLLAHDVRLGYQTVFETAFPEIMLSAERNLLPLLEMITRLLKPVSKFQKVPLNWQQPGEEDVAFVSLGWPETINWGHFFPSAFEPYVSEFALMGNSSAQAEDWKKRYAYWVQKLSLKKGRQLVLKNPPNTARIPLLLELFPNARFIFIHRNPFDVYASNRYLWKIIEEGFAFQKTSEAQIASHILWSYRKIMERYLETRKLIPAGNLVEIAFESLVKDPVARLGEVYAAIDLPGYEQVEKHLADSKLLSTPYHQTTHALTEEEVKSVEEQWGPVLQ